MLAQQNRFDEALANSLAQFEERLSDCEAVALPVLFHPGAVIVLAQLGQKMEAVRTKAVKSSRMHHTAADLRGIDTFTFTGTGGQGCQEKGCFEGMDLVLLTQRSDCFVVESVAFDHGCAGRGAGLESNQALSSPVVPWLESLCVTQVQHCRGKP